MADNQLDTGSRVTDQRGRTGTIINFPGSRNQTANVFLENGAVMELPVKDLRAVAAEEE